MRGDRLNGTGRPLPWIWEMAAKLQGEQPDDMYRDASVISRSLTAAVDLFDLPAVSTSFDTTLEAEAAGCETAWERGRPTIVEGCIETVDDAFDAELAVDTGRFPAFLDATDRLVANTTGASVLGGVTGPATLVEHTLVEGSDGAVVEEAWFSVGDLCLDAANAHLDRGADGIALLEPDGLPDDQLYRDAASPLCNILDHYERPGVVICRRVTPEDIELAGTLGFDGITGYVDDPDRALKAASDHDITLGLGVPGDAFSTGPDAVSQFVEELPSDALVSSEWTAPDESPPESMHELMGSI